MPRCSEFESLTNLDIEAAERNLCQRLLNEHVPSIISLLVKGLILCRLVSGSLLYLVFLCLKVLQFDEGSLLFVEREHLPGDMVSGTCHLF